MTASRCGILVEYIQAVAAYGLRYAEQYRGDLDSNEEFVKNLDTD